MKVKSRVVAGSLPIIEDIIGSTEDFKPGNSARRSPIRR